MTGTGQAPSARPPLPSARAGLTPRHTAGAEPVFAELSKGQELFTRTVDLDRGALIAEGAPAAVRADPRVREVYLGSGAVTGAH